MLKKSLCLALVCSLLFCCVCCSSSPAGSEKPDTAEFTFCDIAYSVPSDWNSYPGDDDPEAPLDSASHSSRTADIDLDVQRFRLDYVGPWSYAEDDVELRNEYLAGADYISGDDTYHGVWYKTDDGAFVYIYELTYPEAYYRLTFTLRGDRDELLDQVHAILRSIRSV